jgi:hypothetical protein
LVARQKGPLGARYKPSGFVDIPFKKVPGFRRSGAEIPHRRLIRPISAQSEELGAEIGLLLFGMTPLRGDR